MTSRPFARPPRRSRLDGRAAAVAGLVLILAGCSTDLPPVTDATPGSEKRPAPEAVARETGGGPVKEVVKEKGKEKENGAGKEKAPARVVREPVVRDGDVIYAVASNDDRLLAIDPKTKAVRTVGRFGMKIGGMEDLVLAPDGRTAIGSYWEGYPGLLTIDLKTGRATHGPRVKGGSLTDQTFIESLTWVDGVLYGGASNAKAYCSDCANLLVRIDPETGRATEVGPFGPDFLNMEAMAYSPEFGLIGADIGTLTPPDFGAINTHPVLARIDLKTGRASRIGDLPPSTIKMVKAPNDAPYISPEGPYVCGLCFAPDGTLYGSTFPTHFGGPSELIVLDPTDATILRTRPLDALNVDGLTYAPGDKTPRKHEPTRGQK